MIDFKSTFDNRGFVHFCNEDEEVIKTYSMLSLENYVTDNRLNIKMVSANGCSSIDPNIIEEEEETNVVQYIDENWFELTKDFYLSNNPTEHVAKHNYAYSKEANS